MSVGRQLPLPPFIAGWKTASAWNRAIAYLRTYPPADEISIATMITNQPCLATARVVVLRIAIASQSAVEARKAPSANDCRSAESSRTRVSHVPNKIWRRRLEIWALDAGRLTSNDSVVTSPSIAAIGLQKRIVASRVCDAKNFLAYFELRLF